MKKSSFFVWCLPSGGTPNKYSLFGYPVGVPSLCGKRWKTSISKVPKELREPKVSKVYSYESNSTNPVRKTFKKLYEQKDLVRNSKDQYGVVCDNIWKESYQRLTLTNLGAYKTSTTKHFDFFDTKRNKKIHDSKNRQILQIKSTTSYQQNWLTGTSISIKDFMSTNSTPLVSNSSTKYLDRVGTLPNSLLQKIQVTSTRKNNAKLLRRDDTSNGTRSGRSVVNIAVEKYSKRIKMKTLNELDTFSIR